MRRRFYLFLWIGVVLGATGVFLFVAERWRMPDWEQELLAREPGIRVLAADRAQQPSNFAPDAAYRVASYSRFEYRSSDESGQPITENLSLPHPPRDVRCVIGAQGNQERAFFVNFYTDHLWNHSWIVHEGPTRTVGGEFDAQFESTLKRLGCDLGV